jgi:hypothetical protein
VKRIESGLEVLLAPGAETAAAMSRIAATVPSSRIQLARPTLEDVFIGIVSGTGPASTPVPGVAPGASPGASR